MMSASAQRPRIGITTSGRDENARFRVSATYVDAVRRAGGLAVLLPAGDPRPEECFAFVDGIVMTGGGDVDPSYYGGGSHPEIYGVDRERDTAEMRLARAIVQAGKPALCICRGMQVLAVAHGGTLAEHVPDLVGESVLHRGVGRYALHEVSVRAGSALARVTGAERIPTASWHHQAVRVEPADFVVTARADDGTIEALETPLHPHLVAVQWHPEHTAHSEPTAQRLFDALLARSLWPGQSDMAR